MRGGSADVGDVLKGAVDAVGVVAPDGLWEEEVEEERSERVPVRVPVRVRRKMPIFVCFVWRSCGLVVRGWVFSNCVAGRSAALADPVVVNLWQTGNSLPFQCSAPNRAFAEQ